MPVELRTIENVELVATGTYALASGVTTFSEEDLAAAVLASQDPTVPAPRIKLGHEDPRFDEAVARGQLDGEPAFGVVANMHLSDDRQTIIGDLVDVPAWLADSMQSSFPGRSVEGGFGFTAPSGRNYSFVVSALSLLGVQWPGVTTLSDLREILEANGAAPAEGELVEAQNAFALIGGQADRYVTARVGEPLPEPQADVLAGLDLGAVQRQFVADLDDGEVPIPDSETAGVELGPIIWWWPRSVRVEDDGTLVLIVDDDEGHLVRMPFTVNGTDLDYGTPEVVVEQYVPVAAAADRARPRVVASWASRAAARPAQPNRTEDNSPMTEEQRRAFALSLGLPEDTSEDRLHEIAAARAAEHSPSPPAPDPAEPPAPTAPEGFTLVDNETLDTLRNGAEAGVTAAARFDEQDRDRIIDEAISQRGRIAAGARDSWMQRWGRDPEGTRTLLTADVEAGGLPDDVIPVAMREVGSAGDGEASGSDADDAEYAAFMARYNPQVAARMQARRESSGVRVRQEV